MRESICAARIGVDDDVFLDRVVLKRHHGDQRRDKHPDPSARAPPRSARAPPLVVGDGRLRDGLERLARELALSDAPAVFVGYREDEGLVYAVVDVLVLDVGERKAVACVDHRGPGRGLARCLDRRGQAFPDVVLDGFSVFLFRQGPLRPSPTCSLGSAQDPSCGVVRAGCGVYVALALCRAELARRRHRSACNNPLLQVAQPRRRSVVSLRRSSLLCLYLVLED